jgi:hypothetical protein
VHAVIGTWAQGDAPDPDELARIEAGFPAFRIWRETVLDRTRYTARARSLATHPAAVITRDLAELRTALTAGTWPASTRARSSGSRSSSAGSSDSRSDG